MTFDVLSDLNWLGIAAATAVYFILGGLWYSPVMFSRQWMASMGYAPPADQGSPSLAYMIAPLITCFLEVLVIAGLAVATGSDTFGEGLVLGIFVAVIADVLFAVTAFFSPTFPNKMSWYLITAGYHVLGALVAGVLVAVV